MGDAVTCFPLTFVDGSGSDGVRVDCSAPGPASSSNPATTIGIVLGAVAGFFILVCLGGWWCHNRQKANEADKLRASMGMSTRSQLSTAGINVQV